MSFAILHMQKLKQPALKGMQIHNQREKESQTNPDIDRDRSHLNYDFVNLKPVDYNEKINEMIEEGVSTGKKIRKDAVKVASFLVTSDREFFENRTEREERDFFAAAYDFFGEKYGKQNIAYAVVHKDEKTPHMHLGFVPITEDGRLSAKDFFGQKKQLVKLQDEFHSFMKESGFDLERGLSSDRKHIESARFKAETFANMERESKEKYEKTMSQLQAIQDSSEMIESIDPKKVPMMGARMVKEEDYQVLMDHAKAGALHKVQAENLKDELEQAQNRIAELKTENEKDQEKVRKEYEHLDKEIEIVRTENENIKENLEKLVDQKAEAQAELIALANYSTSPVVVENNRLRNQIEQNKKAWKEAWDKAMATIKSKNREIADLKEKNVKLENKVLAYQTENSNLKRENHIQSEKIKGLESKVKELFNGIVAMKQHAAELLNAQFSRIKSFLNIHNVNPKVIRDLDSKKERFVGESLEAVVNRNQKRQHEKEMEIER